MSFKVWCVYAVLVFAFGAILPWGWLLNFVGVNALYDTVGVYAPTIKYLPDKTSDPLFYIGYLSWMCTAGLIFQFLSIFVKYDPSSLRSRKIQAHHLACVPFAILLLVAGQYVLLTAEFVAFGGRRLSPAQVQDSKVIFVVVYSFLWLAVATLPLSMKALFLRVYDVMKK